MRNLDILAAESGEHVRVLLCREEQSYVVSCQHFRMPYPVASDLLAELQPVPAETYSVFVLDEDITNRQRDGRNRKLDLIAPLLEDACIYDKSHRNEVVRQIAAEHGIARRTVLQYLWRYWVYQSKNALLPAERPAPEQHELTADEKAIRWALNKYYYTPQRQSLQTAYKMMLRAKYCDAKGRLQPEYPSFWRFRYFSASTATPSVRASAARASRHTNAITAHYGGCQRLCGHDWHIHDRCHRCGHLHCQPSFSPPYWQTCYLHNG